MSDAWAGIPALKKAYPGASILILTVSESKEDLGAAMQAGTDSYLLKTVESDQLCDSIIKILNGECVISQDLMTKFVAAFRTKAAPTQELSPFPWNHPRHLKRHSAHSRHARGKF
ncbi:hypothetical protein [Rhodoferax sp.]|uniref:hypothetical protein n=1 Tax=Rhodoferax sp. TaxID=50421 RepID=UPI00262A7B89|nr:hypothetical protein [Rhodoferax sp.]MDD2809190.1 hypothetical protein [Rhodoferax sp.]